MIHGSSTFVPIVEAVADGFEKSTYRASTVLDNPKNSPVNIFTLDRCAISSIEALIRQIKARVTTLIVTHNMRQTARVSDFTTYRYLGELLKLGLSDERLALPKHKRT